MEIMIPENFSVKEVKELESLCEKYIKRGSIDFVFNFKDCKFMDSTGLGAIVFIYKTCTELGGSVRLTEVDNKSVLKVFSLTRLDEVFDL